MPRLGQLLVRADLVSENNLARALGVQHFAGGRIGTLLLERGSVSEDDIGTMLSRQHGCEYVRWASLADVPSTTIALLPARFAIKHAAIPYDRSESSIKLALRDPADLRILDELFFVTGRKIVAGVAPEVRIYQALEKYYAERRTPRFAILAEKLSRPARGGRSGFIPPPPPPQFFPERATPSRVAPEAHEIWGDSPEPDFGTGPPIIQSWQMPDLDRGRTAAPAPAPAPKPKPSRPTPKPARKSPDADIEPISWDEMPPGISWAEMPAAPALWTDSASTPTPASSWKPAAPPTPPLPMPSADKPPSAERPAPRPSAPPPAMERPRPQALPEAVPPPRPTAVPPAAAPGAFLEGHLPTAADFARVAAATDRDGIAEAALAALGRRFSSAAIFAARPDSVTGWAVVGKVNGAAIRSVKIPWSEPSVFLNVRLSRSFYLGPLLKLPRHQALAAAFGSWPEECAVQPVLIREKPAAFLYVESPRDGVTPMDLVYLRELAGAMGSALAAAIRLKKKEI
ncbi:MAG TPA: hypothetical protein VOA00_00180 [Thermoanaerobaculia bacterium]|nr:hypothetical protein [Thermoanaerobaculia bacterium]